MKSLTMRGYIVGLMLTLLCTPGLKADLGEQSVEIGDTRARVIEVLGKPQGAFRAGERELLQFRKGEVTLEHGKVTKVKVVSAAERKQLEERARVRAQAAAASRAEHLSAGRAEKAAKLEDEGFAALPIQEQVAYWRNFSKRYPQVSVQTELAALNTAAGAAAQERVKAIDERLVEINGEIEEANAGAMTKATINQTRKRREARVRRTALKAERDKLLAERQKLAGP